jgi:hypothetical protein
LHLARTCHWVAAGNALCKHDHVWLHGATIKLPMRPPHAAAACTRLHLQQQQQQQPAASSI